MAPMRNKRVAAYICDPNLLVPPSQEHLWERVTVEKQPSPSASAPGTYSSVVKKKRPYPSYPSASLPVFKSYMEELEEKGEFDLTSTFGKHVPRGICVISKEALSHPKLQSLVAFAIEEHNKRCRLDGHENLQLVRALKMNYQITPDGTFYYISLEAVSCDQKKNEYQVGVFVCDLGCMQISKFMARPNPDVRRSNYELHKCSRKRTPEEMENLREFATAEKEREREVMAVLNKHIEKHGRGSFVVDEMCGELYVTEPVCSHRRLYFYDLFDQLLLFRPFHRIKIDGSSLVRSTCWASDPVNPGAEYRLIDPGLITCEKVKASSDEFGRIACEKWSNVCSKGLGGKVEILDQRCLRTRKGWYSRFLARWPGKNGTRLAWIGEKEKQDLIKELAKEQDDISDSY